MKKCALSVAFLLIFGSYATAQKQTVKDNRPAKQKEVKKGNDQKAKDNTPVIKLDSSSNQAKVKLVLPPADTSGTIPKSKQRK